MTRTIRLLIVGGALFVVSLGTYYFADQRVNDLRQDYEICLDDDDTDYEECEKFEPDLSIQVRLVALGSLPVGLAIAALSWPAAAGGSAPKPTPTPFSNGLAEAMELRRRGALTDAEFNVVRQRLGV